MKPHVLALCALTAAVLPFAAHAASNDNNVEWNGLAHVHSDPFYYSGDPATPSDTVTIKVRTFKGDVTSVGVLIAPEGSTTNDYVFVAGVWDSNDNTQTYDFWRVVINGFDAPRRYCPSIIDGTDNDFLFENSAAPFYDVWGGPSRPDPVSRCWLIPAAYPATDAGTDAAVGTDSAPRVDATQPDTAPRTDAAPHVDARQPDTAVATDAAHADSATTHDSAVADGRRPDTAAADHAAADHAAVDHAGGADTRPLADAGPVDHASSDLAAADSARADSATGNCTPGCQDDANRIVCNASGQPLVVPCTGGTTCSDGRCVSSTEPPADDGDGCGCAATTGAAPLALALLALGWRRRR